MESNLLGFKMVSNQTKFNHINNFQSYSDYICLIRYILYYPFIRSYSFIYDLMGSIMIGLSQCLNSPNYKNKYIYIYIKVLKSFVESNVQFIVPKFLTNISQSSTQTSSTFQVEKGKSICLPSLGHKVMHAIVLNDHIRDIILSK